MEFGFFLVKYLCLLIQLLYNLLVIAKKENYWLQYISFQEDGTKKTVVCRLPRYEFEL